VRDCVKRFFTALRAVKNLFTQSLTKSFFLALRAKLNLDRDIFLLISQSEISKKMSLSKAYFAACCGKERLCRHPFLFPNPCVG